MTDLPAGWSPRTELLGDQWASLDPALQDASLTLAVRELWALSGRQFGTWSVRVAPFIAARRPSYYADSYFGVPYYAFNAAAGIVEGGIGVAPLNRVFQLPRPVVSVEAVTLDGVALARGVDWEADPGGQLVWLPAAGGWPIAQNVYATPAPRWIVTYTRGVPVPDDGQIAAARYALAIAQGLGAPGQDKVPGRARDYSRNNVNVQLASPESLSNVGLTGVPLVDAWLRMVNPNVMDRPAQLWTPDLGRHRILPAVTG